MAKNLFEVFLGTYNAEPWIEDVIRSLEAQEIDPFLVNIIDNASTDKTIDILNNLFDTFELKNTYKLIKNQKNIGAISSFLDRLELFDSEWIIMIHQDDYYHPDHIKSLVNEIKQVSPTCSIAFTAMQRMDGSGNESLSVPSLSPLLSEKDRVENFMLALQLSPINFPACALRKDELKKTSTSRHTTAFNDAEMLIKLMCVSDVKYIPKETMHYRVYSGNAASITSSMSNDFAISIGLIEMFHSSECLRILHQVNINNSFDRLIGAIESALEIRIADIGIRSHTRLIIAESLVRRFGYSNQNLANFLIQSLEYFDLSREITTVKNLHESPGYDFVKSSTEKKGFEKEILSGPKTSVHKKNKFFSVVNLLPLSVREGVFNRIFSSFLFSLSRRPFIKVWRSNDKRR